MLFPTILFLVRFKTQTVNTIVLHSLETTKIPRRHMETLLPGIGFLETETVQPFKIQAIRL